MDEKVKTEVTRFGFIYGSATVERICSGRFGVVITIFGAREEIDVRVTPGGRVSVIETRTKRKQRGA